MHILKNKARDIIEHAEPNLGLIGLFGFLGYPVYYLIWAYIFPQPYENLALRLFCAIISLPWAIYRILPKQLKEIFPLYFFLSLFIVIPYFFSFMMLKNEWSVVWVMSLLTGIFLLTMFIANWVLISSMTVGGFIAAYLTLLVLDGKVSFTYFKFEYIPIFLFSIAGGIIANHKQQRAQRSKLALMRSLSGSIAHEMRNPLNAITNAIASVQNTLPVKPGSDAAAKSYYRLSHSGLIHIHNIIEESSHTLNSANKIIDSILNSLQGGQIVADEFIRIKSEDAINAAITRFPYNDSKEKKFISFNNIRSFDFFGDRDLFFFVLFNLLKNALYYKDKLNFGIEITTDATTANNIIRVRDNGPGIKKKNTELIFESFYTSNKKGGNGLGLSFCKRVVESFEGSITCDSKEGEWTEFTITLPKYHSKTVREIKNKILCKKRILVTDDQLSSRLIITKYLADLHCQIDHADNGLQAIAMLSENRYDLIFMDFEMPFLNGDRAVKLIRSAQNIDPSLALYYRDAPIIGITALPQPEAEARGRKCGMNEVLAKPVSKIAIRKIIDKYFFSEVLPLRNDIEEKIVSGKQILLVDDNVTSRKIMSELLEHYGYRIEQAVNGREALEFLDKKDFDLILMDVEMPVMDGVEAAKAIRRGDNFARFRSGKSIPIIALTGNNDELSVRNIKEAGMNYHLCKPVFKDKLISAINLLLQNNISESDAVIDNSTVEQGQPNIVFWNTIKNEIILDRSVIDELKEIGGDELIVSLFETFIADANKLMIELVAAVDEKNMKQFDHIIHTLKGTTGSIGAKKMYLLCGHINEFSRKGEWPDNSSWVKILQTVYAETVDKLHNHINLFAQHPS
jgi:two-component system CAI-1 autoinducer sensor kinase/phosphatase CqsS